MARRRYDFLKVKTRDNLGDPEYWNRRLEDLDRRITQNEGALETIDQVPAQVEKVALDRINLVLTPALQNIALASEQGFLLAHSSTEAEFVIGEEVTLNVGGFERELFAPSPYVTVVREDNDDDYIFARVRGYSKQTGDLVLEAVQVFGDGGPHSDWIIYVGTAVTRAVETMLVDLEDYRAEVAAAKIGTAADRVATHSDRLAAETARQAAETAAGGAANWDPTNYLRRDINGTITATVSFQQSPLVPTAAANDESEKAASTAFVKSVSALLEGGQTLAGGFDATSVQTAMSSGTFTPNPKLGAIQNVINSGAHAIAPPLTPSTVIVQYANVAGAGALTASGFTKVTGLNFSSAVDAKHILFITRTKDYSHLHIVGL